jgi:hypothetical protein
MSTRAVNLAILAIILVELLSGVVSYLVGTPDGRLVFWVHRVGGFALLPLLGWKAGIVVRSYRKRGLTRQTALSAVLATLLLGALAYGVLWSAFGVDGFELPVLGSLTGLGVHVTLAVALLPLLLVHLEARWPQVRLRRPDFASRRAAIRYLGLSAVGLAVWQAGEAVTRAAGWPGARRRFTGSTEIGSLSGNGFPATNWFSDPKPDITAEAWQLRIHGAVERDVVIGWHNLMILDQRTIRAVLDCTGGWFTEQDWSGVPVAALLAGAGISDSARSVVFRSETGYARRYGVDELDRLLLATSVGREPLSRGHGYPVRLVAPGRRGFEWVKWVVELEVSPWPAWLEAPLPLQ